MIADINDNVSAVRRGDQSVQGRGKGRERKKGAGVEKVEGKGKGGKGRERVGLIPVLLFPQFPLRVLQRRNSRPRMGTCFTCMHP